MIFALEEIVCLVIGIIFSFISLGVGIYLMVCGGSENIFWGIVFLILTLFIMLVCFICVKQIIKKAPPVKRKSKENYVSVILNKISKSDELYKQYKEATSLANLSLLLPAKSTLKFSSLWNYYKYFYKDNNSLAVLYVIMKNPDADETRHPLNDEIIKTFDSLDEITERVLITYPWLVKLDPIGRQYQKQ